MSGRSTLDGLADDLRSIARRVKPDAAKVVAKNAKFGMRLAKGFARKSSGTHGRRYPGTISAARRSALSYEYGPREGARQGGMSFERGSRNQPPHNDLAKSLDIVAPKFDLDVRHLPDDWFW